MFEFDWLRPGETRFTVFPGAGLVDPARGRRLRKSSHARSPPPGDQLDKAGAVSQVLAERVPGDATACRNGSLQGLLSGGLLSHTDAMPIGVGGVETILRSS